MRKSHTTFILFTLIAAIFFLLPVYYNEKLTVPFDIAISLLKTNFPSGVKIYTLLVLFGGAILTIGARLSSIAFLKSFNSSIFSLIFRLLGAFLGLFYFLYPDVSLFGIQNLIFNILAVSVALIIPIGSIFVQFFIYYGGLEFIGTLFSPLMSRLFKLPGYAALDALTSWVGSYSVGLYLTRRVYQKGMYTRKHVAIIATCFSTVSIGFAGVIAATLNIFRYFPFLIIFYFFAIVYLTFILVRIPPLSAFPDLTYDQRTLELNHHSINLKQLFTDAYENAIKKAETAPPIGKVVSEGIWDGISLAMNIVGSIIVVGSMALLLAKGTPVFEWLGYPFMLLLKIFGLPSSPIIGAAVISAISEMYIPALLVIHSPLDVKIFIALLSLSQLIFFSSLGPMIMEMFLDIPITFFHLVSLFLIRTLLLLPFCSFALFIFHMIYG